MGKDLKMWPVPGTHCGEERKLMSVGECLPGQRGLRGLGGGLCISIILGIPTKSSMAHTLVPFATSSIKYAHCSWACWARHAPPPWSWLSQWINITYSVIWKKTTYTMINTGQLFLPLFCPEAGRSLALWWTAKSPIGRGLRPQVVGVHRLAPETHAAGAT